MSQPHGSEVIRAPGFSCPYALKLERMTRPSASTRGPPVRLPMRPVYISYALVRLMRLSLPQVVVCLLACVLRHGLVLRKVDLLHHSFQLQTVIAYWS